MRQGLLFAGMLGLCLTGCVAGTRVARMGPLPGDHSLVTLVVSEDPDVVTQECANVPAARAVLGCQMSWTVPGPGVLPVRVVKIVRYTDSLPSPLAFEIDVHELCHAVAALQVVDDPCHHGNGGIAVATLPRGQTGVDGRALTGQQPAAPKAAAIAMTATPAGSVSDAPPTAKGSDPAPADKENDPILATKGSDPAPADEDKNPIVAHTGSDPTSTTAANSGPFREERAAVAWIDPMDGQPQGATPVADATGADRDAKVAVHVEDAVLEPGTVPAASVAQQDVRTAATADRSTGDAELPVGGGEVVEAAGEVRRKAKAGEADGVGEAGNQGNGEERADGTLVTRATANVDAEPIPDNPQAAVPRFQHPAL